jgi:peptidoglycan hydrolase-like amidase/putative cell wall-binding protein
VPDGEVQVLGRGWGHGVGMSQYGARGAARLGCTAAEILAAYYPGTTVTQRAEAPITVSLYPDRPNGPGVDFLDVYAETDAVQWQVSAGGTGAGQDFAITQTRGTTWRATVASDGRYVVADQSRGGEIVHTGSINDTIVVPLGNRHIIQLPQKPSNDQWRDGRPYRRGELRIRPFGGTDTRLSTRITLPDVHSYLYGLSEMPASWELQALEVQAIAGRSYALRNAARPLFDSPSDQVYTGLLKETDRTGVGGGQTAGQRWVQAVDESRGRVVTFDGDIAQTFYSSSHGGQSESNRFSAFFSASTVLPYLVPVDDTRWEAAADSPVATWSHAYSRAEAGRALGVGAVTSIRLLEQRGAGGRVGVPGRPVYSNPSATYGGVEVVGTTGRKTISGLAFVQALNVTRRSELFEVRIAPSQSPTPEPSPAPAPEPEPAPDPEPSPAPPPAPIPIASPLDPCAPTRDQSGNTVATRVAGPGRIDTAVAASQAGWSTASEAVLATAGGTSQGFADALSAAALAARHDAPLLLTGAGELAPPVREELARLGVRTVHLMGGTAALSADVQAELRLAGYRVERVAGASRFDTARAAALKAGPSPSGDVALALGTDWPDAVSAGALAASADRVPALLSLRDAVPETTMVALRELDPGRVVLIGGRGVLSSAVVEQLRAAGYAVERLSGASRYGTSLAVAVDAARRGGADARPAVLASGGTFPDALAAGPVAARQGGLLLLAPRCNLDDVPDVSRFLTGGPIDRAVLIGGTAALSDRVREQTGEAISR